MLDYREVWRRLFRTEQEAQASIHK